MFGEFSPKLKTPSQVKSGGLGQDMTMQTLATSGNVFNMLPGLIKYTGNGTLSIRGIAAPTSSSFCFIQNVGVGSSVVQLSHLDSSAQSVNQIITSSGGGANINNGFGAILFYDFVVKKWRLHNLDYLNSVSSPFTVTAGNLSMSIASSGTSGYLTNIDWSTFNNKVSASGGAPYRVPIMTGGNTQTATAIFNYDPVNARFGVGTTDYTYNEATGHFKSDTPETLGVLSGISVTLTASPALAAPYVYNVTQQAGHMYAPTSQNAAPTTPHMPQATTLSATQQAGHMYAVTGQTATQGAGHLFVPNTLSGTSTTVGGATTYSAGDVIDYLIYSWDISEYSTTYATVQTTITTTGDDSVLAWTENNSGTQGINNYRIYRQINLGGYNDYIDILPGPGYSDDSTGFTGGSPPPTPQYPDFVANNTTYDYQIWQAGYDGVQFVWSVVNSVATLTDDNSGNPFVIPVSWTGNIAGSVAPGMTRIYRSIAGAGYSEYIEFAYGTFSFTDDNTLTWTTSASPPSPQYPDYIANGAVRNYQIWQAGDDGVGGYIWAVAGIVVTLSDDSSGNPYVVSVGWSGSPGTVGSPTNFRTYHQVNGGGYNDYYDSLTGTMFTDDTAFTWTGGSPNPTPNYNDLIAMGNTYDYQIWQAGDDGVGGYTWSVIASIASMTDASDGSIFDNFVYWTVNNAGTVSPFNLRVYRQISGGGYLEYQDVGLVSGFTDDGTNWNSGSPAPSPQYPDFIASGLTRHYSAFSDGLDPRGNRLFSPTSYDVPFGDDSSGNPYVILQTAYSSSAANIRILNTDLTTYYDVNSGTGFYEDTTETGWISGSTVTPNTYGILSDGTTLNRDYDFYNYNGTIYSTSSGIYSTVDPNDGLYYYNRIVFGSISTSAKILRQINSGGYNDSEVSATSPIYDDGVTPFAGNTTVTPNVTYPMALLGEMHGSSISDRAALTLRSLDGTYTRMDFQDNTSTRLGYIEQNASHLAIQSATTMILDTGDSLSFTAVNNATLTTPTINMNATSSGVLNANGVNRFGWSAGGAAMYAPSGGNLGLVYNGTYFLTVDSAGVTINGGFNIANGLNVVLGTSTGTQFGTSTSQKIGFYGKTAIIQPTATTDLGVALSNLGLRAVGTAYPITTSGTKNFGDLTASTIMATDGSKNVVSLALATYPSLTELSYVKGVTSAIQTQLNAKGSGTVTSVSGSGGTTGLTLTGGAITTSGTLTLGGTLGVANGGTNIASYAVGDLLYASGSTTLSKLADVATGNALISGGVTTAPSWGKIGLTTHVSGTLAYTNGGTGIATIGTANQIPTVNAGATALNYLYAINQNIQTVDNVTFNSATLTTPLSVANGGTGQTASRRLFTDFADANNGTTVETDLYTHNIPAGKLTSNGDTIFGEYYGVFSGAVSATQQLKVYFGGTAIFDSGALAIGVATPSWDIYVSIIRVSSSIVRCAVSITTSSAALASTAQYTAVTGLTLANAQTMKITGTAAGVGGGSSQITAKGSFIDYEPI